VSELWDPGAGLHRVVVLARHGVMPMELGIVHQMFRSARTAAGEALYEVATCTPVPGAVRTDADFTLWVRHGIELLTAADTVLVPASHESDEHAQPIDAHTAEELAALPQQTRIASICTGAFVLAAAGLLEGRRATTHWMSADRFRRRHPTIDLDPDVLFTDNGAVLTSAGEAAGIDLCLHMIRCDHGAAVANEVARRTIVPAHRDGGQAQYIPRPVPDPVQSTTSAVREWALHHLDQRITLRDLAHREALSVRTFTRRFRAEVGISPGQWLAQQRTERARHLLETTDLPIDHVATAAGFGTSASLRQHLRATLGVSPSAYRHTFQGTSQPRPAPGRRP
jgi:transcriptional regulator GlxA family with amidase domain